MEFKEAMRIWKRMCKALGDGCEECQLERLCSGGLREYPIEAESIIAKWAEEHPEKTIADDFYEKHPNAPGKQDKQPLPCAVHCGYIDKCPDDFSALECKKCWRRPLEEAER